MYMYKNAFQKLSKMKVEVGWVCIIVVTFLYSGFISDYFKRDGKNHVANALLQI